MVQKLKNPTEENLSPLTAAVMRAMEEADVEEINAIQDYVRSAAAKANGGKEVNRLADYPDVFEESAEGGPSWASLIRKSPEWAFQDDTLVHRDAPTDLGADGAQGGLKRMVVNHVYASHKRSRTVKAAIEGLLDGFGEDQWGLNFGAGATKFHERILNLDIGRGPKTDIVNWGHELPFRSNSLDLVLSQEVLEHVDDPFHWIAEIHRVLKPGGKFYCQMPFIIGYHPGPTDFWRFTKEAYPQMFPNRLWEMEQLELTLGHGSALYRILVEFMAVTASVVHSKLYMPVKGASALAFAPIQWFDALTKFSNQKDRIPGGYLCVVEKR